MPFLIKMLDLIAFFCQIPPSRLSLGLSFRYERSSARVCCLFVVKYLLIQEVTGREEIMGQNPGDCAEWQDEARNGFTSFGT